MYFVTLNYVTNAIDYRVGLPPFHSFIHFILKYFK